MRKLFCSLALSALVCSSAQAITNEDLATNTWMPLEQNSSSSCEVPPLIEFHKDGSIYGEPGCNTLTGSYKLTSDGRIDLSAMGMTRKLCAKDYMQQEDHFMDLLRKTEFLKLENKQLILLDKEKKEVGRLVPEKSKACN